MKDAFNLSLPEYLYYGAYPQVLCPLLAIMNGFNNISSLQSLIRPLTRIYLWTLLSASRHLRRKLFELGAAYSGELLSLNKMLGMLQDAGNTSTLLSYLNLLNDSGLLCGLQKFSIDMARRKAEHTKIASLQQCA